MGAQEKAKAAWGVSDIATTGNGYSREGFYCRATDHHGHGERISFKIPPDVYAQIMQVVEDKALPDYQVVSDFARDAMVHLLHQRQDMLEDPTTRDANVDLLQRIAFEEFSRRVKEDVERWEQMHEELYEAFTKLARTGAWGQLAAYTHRAEDLVSPVPEPYRSQTERLIKEWRDRVPEEYKTW